MSLPALVHFHGNWSSYIDEVYQIYLDTIVCNKKLKFQGLRIRCRYDPATFNKGFSFWHVTQEGPAEKDRLPDLRRCERIRWIAWAIANADFDQRISWWIEKRNGKTSAVIWLEQDGYLVVLDRRKKYWLLRTAYCPTRPHKIASLRKNRSRYQKP